MQCSTTLRHAACPLCGGHVNLSSYSYGREERDSRFLPGRTLCLEFLLCSYQRCNFPSRFDACPRLRPRLQNVDYGLVYRFDVTHQALQRRRLRGNGKYQGARDAAVLLLGK